MPEMRLCLTGKNRIIEVVGPADITQEITDAIVNAANSFLMGGGGVDGAIHRAGGPAIVEECRKYVAANGELPAGKAMITGGGRLGAQYVIHTVGPIYRDGASGEAELLASCHRESLRLAEESGLKSISFPAISTGAYGYPLHEAANVAIDTAADSLANTSSVTHVRFVLFDHAALKAYSKAAEQVLRDRQGWLLDSYRE